MIDFGLPKQLIAQEPASPRDSARLLVYERESKKIKDTVFSELPKFLPKNSTVVLNNSKVENCRWLFDEGRTEIFVLEKLDQHTIRALVRPGKKFRLDQKSKINKWLSAVTTNIDSDGIRTIVLNVKHDDARFKVCEHVPLPPYIKQNDKLAKEYQTIYAKPLGSKAAPTAGLHFTDTLLDKISRSHEIVELTLHVGLGTFAGLTDKNFKTGRLHSETYEISANTIAKLNSAKHITAVGTTTTRTLESLESKITSPVGQVINEGLSGNTDIFIQPGYEFKIVDSLITNFHLPGTSLLLMVEAFVGSEEEMQRIYKHAINEKYRFYSFGDAMLIL